MSAFDPSAYGAIGALLASVPENELGPADPQRSFYSALCAVTPEKLVEPNALGDRSAAVAAIAGIWLRFDFFDESHQLSQSLDTKDGSYWHGILHRREPDYDNAKYWFRRVRAHRIFEPLGQEARRLAAPFAQTANEQPLIELTADGRWDPCAFVDACAQAARSGGELAAFCRAVAAAEWQLLFDDCYRRAKL